MPDYFHSALRGEQIHEAKIKTLVEGSAMPVPEWEGQFVAVGKKLYYSVKQSNVLTWIQPVAYNAPQLPNNVVVFETGYENPPAPRNKPGVIYQNIDTKDLWYSQGANWIKLGKSQSDSTLNIISGRSTVDWQGNYFGLLNPQQANQENCLIMNKWESKKYYFGINTPTMLSLGGSDDNLFYVGMWNEYYQRTVISSHPENSKNLLTLDMALFNQQPPPFKIGLFIKRNFTDLFLNFEFDLDVRYFNVKGLANISYGY